MFAEMRSVLGIPKSVDILEHIYSLGSPSDTAAQEEAMAKIRAIERREMAHQTPQPGLADLMAYLDHRRLPKGICTRNFDAPVHHLLTHFLPGSIFEPIITREFRPPKPDPAGILFIARSWGFTRALAEPPAAAETQRLVDGSDESPAVKAGAVAKTAAGVDEVGDASHLIMVGDSIDDMTAGRAAGAATVLLVNEANKHLADHAHTDLVIERLDELVDVLERGFVGREHAP